VNPNVAGVAAVDAAGNPIPNPTLVAAITAPDLNEMITVNMPGNSAQEVLDWLQRNTGKIVIQSPTLPQARIIFSTNVGYPDAQGRYPGMPRGEVIKAVLGLLAMNQVIVVPMGDHSLKAESAADGGLLSQVVPNIDDAGLNSDSNAQIYGHFFKLDYMSSDDAAGRVQPFLNQRATVIS
jgi:hypothetical protein